MSGLFHTRMQVTSGNEVLDQFLAYMQERVETMSAALEEIQVLLSSEKNMHSGAFCVCSDNDVQVQ